MALFSEIKNSHLYLDVWQGSEYAYVMLYLPLINHFIWKFSVIFDTIFLKASFGPIVFWSSKCNSIV